MRKLEETQLYRLLQEEPALLQEIEKLRKQVTWIGERIGDVLPGYTDHSIRHMDSLWWVADCVFTEGEIEKFSKAEAFLLCASFYFHDLGMGMAVTEDGKMYLERSTEYKSILESLRANSNAGKSELEEIALETTARILHANEAATLPLKKFPGLDRYLIETTDIRTYWGEWIGSISASHHWPIGQVADELGSKGVVPTEMGGDADLAFVACALRVIDYAHSNFERANIVDRLTRRKMPAESLIHWRAQGGVVGPSRVDNKLKYTATNSINDIDAWWLAYEIFSGLDEEIREVSSFLRSRESTKNRFSLEGVWGVESLSSFSTLFEPGGFDPIDVRIKPDSIERLIEILGGKTLYGNDYYAPIRELIQNSRDAIFLRDAVAGSFDRNTLPPGEISIELDSKNGKLRVSDNGIGMTSEVLTEYLLGIASDYWSSEHFFRKYPNLKPDDFSPIGRFGIGFLSVFMLADRVTVSTKHIGSNKKHHLVIRGVGKRGSISTVDSYGESGTIIELELRDGVSFSVETFFQEIVRRAPMLPFRIKVNLDGVENLLEPGWWRSSPQEDFLKVLDRAIDSEEIGAGHHLRGIYRLRGLASRYESQWIDEYPEIVKHNYRVVADTQFGALSVCSKGIQISEVPAHGLRGIVDLGQVEMNAARDEILEWNATEFRQEVLSELKIPVSKNLNKFGEEKNVPNYFNFLVEVGNIYSPDVLRDSSIPFVGVVERSGETRMLSLNEVQEYAEKANLLSVVFGENPWSSRRLIETRYGDEYDVENSAVFVVSGAAQTEPRPDLHDEVVFGTLDELFSERENFLEGVVLLRSFLTSVATAWNISIDGLLAAHWSTKRFGTLCGIFYRS